MAIYNYGFGPAGTGLEELVLAGTRWVIVHGAGSAMLAHACLTVIGHQAMEQGEKGATAAPTKN